MTTSKVYSLGKKGGFTPALFNVAVKGHHFFKVEPRYLNQDGLKLLYKDHPWVWFDIQESHGLQFMSVDSERDIEKCDGAFAVYSRQCQCRIWIGKGGALGFESLSVRVDKKRRRLVLHDYYPYEIDEHCCYDSDCEHRCDADCDADCECDCHDEFNELFPSFCFK